MSEAVEIAPPPDDPLGTRCRVWLAVAADPPPQAAPAVALAEAVRRLLAASTGTAASEELLTAAAAAVGAVADELEPHRQPSRHGQGERTAGDDGRFLTHPVLGPTNGLAPPIRVEAQPGSRVVGTARYGTPYEGPRGFVHGGHLAAGFDGVLAMAAGLAGRLGPTRTLEIRYVRPTPLHVPVVYEAWVDRVDGRSTFVEGRASVDGAVTVTAVADFAFNRTQGDAAR